jgi:hypothetical protein
MFKFSLAEHILIVACLIGLSIMVYHVKTGDDNAIYFLFIPVVMMIIAKYLIKKDINED